MTTIGTAVLQIIPSLRGVTEEIEKQLDGKVVEVPIQPKVDQAAAKKAGKDTGAVVAKEANEAAAKTPIEPKIDKPAAKKAGKEAGETIAKETKASVEKASPGKELAKVIVDGIADGVKQELPGDAIGRVGRVLVDGLADGVKQGIDGKGGKGNLGKEIVAGLLDGMQEGLQGTVVTDALGGLLNVDITGPVSAITGALNPLRDAVAGFKEGDLSSGLAATEQALRGLEGIGIPPDIGDAVSRIGDVADTSKGQVSQFLTPLESVSKLAGPDSQLYKVGGKLPIIGEIAEAIPVLDQANTEAENLVTSLTGLNVPLSPKSALARLLDGAFDTADDKAHEALRIAQDAEQQNRQPVQRDPNWHRPGHKAGGQIFGPGTGTSDSILAWLSNEEFIVNADATRKNLPLLNAINSGNLPGFSGGGAVNPDVSAAEKLVGTPYSQGARNDCSGTVAKVINAALGQGGGLMTTKTAQAWLSARGFISGTGGPGTISVGWYDHGPNPNDGHMAMTLSDGRNAEAGGSHGAFLIGGAAKGANSAGFDRHMYLPNIFGEGLSGPATTTGAAPAGTGSGQGAPTSASGGPGPLPTSLSGLLGFGLNGLGKGVGTTQSGSDLSLLSGAAGAAVTGQVSSALGVFGISDTPPILQAASTFLGGLSIGGHDASGKSDGSVFNGSNLSFGQGSAGSSAAPVSATSSLTGTLPPDDAAHGSRAGQAPGTVNNWNIRTATVEDAFLKAQRKQNEQSAAKTSRY